MKLPASMSRITLDRDFRAPGPFPPPGFVPFEEGAFGDGDTYGLYWPIGREHEEPLVVELRHEDWELVPLCSSLDAFLAAAEGAEEDESIEPPSLAADPRSPLACFDAATDALQAQQAEPAAALLERAVAVLPEYTDALALLAAQHRRLGRHDVACEVAVRAIISPPSFGERPVKLLRWLAAQREAPPSLVDDPIWQARGDLRLVFGGAKENADYPLLLGAIDAYLARAELVKAATLMQTYAELMHGETVSFQERYGFREAEFASRQADVARLAGGPRRLEP